MVGNHGDEYPGQVAIPRLARELDPGQVRGRLILIPALNIPASRAIIPSRDLRPAAATRE